jgi:hypothetical protein
MLYDVEHGALTQLYAGTAPEAVELNGKVKIPSNNSRQGMLRSLALVAVSSSLGQGWSNSKGCSGSQNREGSMGVVRRTGQGYLITPFFVHTSFVSLFLSSTEIDTLHVSSAWIILRYT